VSIQVREARILSQQSDGARGYPGRLSEAELGAKFLGCARRSLSEPEAEAALAAVRELGHAENVSGLTRACATRS
jgi:hypothetical protein